MARVSHWGTQRGAVGLGDELTPTWAARRWWKSASERGRAPRVCFTRRPLAQQKGETKRRLTRLGNGPWQDTTAQAGRFGGEVGAVFAGGSQVCDFGLPSPADRCARSLRGSHGVSGHGAEPGAWDCGGVRRKTKGFTGRGRGCGPGEAPGAQAKLTRRLGLAVERRSTAGTAVQGLCAAMV